MYKNGNGGVGEIPENKSTDSFVSFYTFCKYVWFVYHLGIFIWQRFIFKYEIKMINY